MLSLLVLLMWEEEEQQEQDVQTAISLPRCAGGHPAPSSPHPLPRMDLCSGMCQREKAKTEEEKNEKNEKENEKASNVS